MSRIIIEDVSSSSHVNTFTRLCRLSFIVPRGPNDLFFIERETMCKG